MNTTSLSVKLNKDALARNGRHLGMPSCRACDHAGPASRCAMKSTEKLSA